MGCKTSIEWADSTWNPITGCLHGCPYCYARGYARRFKGSGGETGETHELRDKHHKVTFEKTEDGKVIPASVQIGSAEPYPFGFDPTFHEYRLEQPRKWVKPKNIFVCSMADLFGYWVPVEWIEKVFKSALKAPQHRYLFLTKNPGRMMDFIMNEYWWYGTTITKPTDSFVSTDRYNTFLSIEPLQEPFEYEIPEGVEDGIGKVNWVIIGAETGNRKDRIIPKAEWIKGIVDRCDRNGVPVFMKDSLIPIIGEENMRREFPWETDSLMEAGKEAGADAAQPVLMPGA